MPDSGQFSAKVSSVAIAITDASTITGTFRVALKTLHGRSSSCYSLNSDARHALVWPVDLTLESRFASRILSYRKVQLFIANLPTLFKSKTTRMRSPGKRPGPSSIKTVN